MCFFRVAFFIFSFSSVLVEVLTNCPQGRFGDDCLSFCLCSKEGTAKCTSDTGECICVKSYTGKLCDHDINECDNLDPPCARAQMYCSNTRGSYKCVCRDGYVLSHLGYCTPCPPYKKGNNCTDLCSCTIEKTVYCEGGVCVCKPGWGGPSCATSYDDCTGVFCPQAAVCVDGHQSYKCKCAPGFRLIEGSCQKYETIAAAIEPEPGMGELVDVFVFYSLPEVYLYKSSVLPNFLYNMMIEENQQSLCQISYNHTYVVLSGSEWFLHKLRNINRQQYGFYSHVKIIFTEAIKSVVHLVPTSDEYYEMILEFDASPKSFAQVECLRGMRISGTSRNLQYAVVHKRQSYLSFQIEFNQTKECVEAPRVEWKFNSLSKQIKQYPKSCMNAEYITQLDINNLIAESGDRQISDHKSTKEILPKSTLPLGYGLICVLAYVHRNREFRASTCGYIEIQPTYVIVGNILPDAEDIAWPNNRPFTLTADFEEPDAKTPLIYSWKCYHAIMDVSRYFTNCNEFKDLYNDLEYDRRNLELPAGFIDRRRRMLFILTVYLKTQPQIMKTDRVTLWGEHTNDFTFIPMNILCLQACGDVISGKQSVTLKTDFPYKEGIILGADYSWTIAANYTFLSDREAAKLIPTLSISAGPTWKGITSTVLATSLTPGTNYSTVLAVNVFLLKFNNSNPSDVGKRVRYYTRIWYKFRVEAAPFGEGCIISPSQGEAVFTIFAVQCKNYRDPVSKLPLTYRLYQLGDTPEMSTLIAYSGTNVLDKITLSTKGGPGVHTIQLFVEVSNVIGTAIKVMLSVKLTVPDQAQVLRRLLGNIKVHSGGQEDARIMKDIATIIATNSTAGFMQKVEARQDILSNVKNLDSSSSENIEQVSQVLSVSVEKDDEILPEGLNDGLKTASRLAKYLGRVSNDNLNLTKTVAQSQVNAISKLMYLTATTGESIVAVNDTNNTEAMDKNKEQSFTAVRTIARIADVLLNSLTVINNNLNMQSEFMSMFVGLNNIRADSSFKVESEDADFNLPTMDSGGVLNEIIESEFEIFKKNPYAWTTSNVHGNLPVIKVSLKREQRKRLTTKERETFRFSKPADVFLNYNASGEENYYSMLIKVVKQTNRVNVIRSSDQSYNIIRSSSCVQITVKVSTTSTTVMKILSPDKLKILVKAKYTNSIGYFDSIYDEEMTEMPFFHPNSVNTSRGKIFRIDDLLFIPQLTKQQIKRNHPYYRIKISLKLNQKVDTTTLQRVEIVRNNTESEDEEQGEFYNVTIQATPHLMSCLHFDEEKADYLSDECTISMFSTLNVMYCRCLVAAAYTGSVLVLPRLINPLEFGLFLEVFKNPLVVSMVIAVWMFYIALISWGRMRDKQDDISNSVTILDDNRENQNYVYLICIVTGWSASSATSSNVFISLKGSWYQSDNHVLQDPTRFLFRSGAEDWFVLTTEDDIGELLAVVVWTDFSGAYPNWFLSSVYVQNMETNESWICAYNNWIGMQQGLAQLQVEIPALQEKIYSSQWTVQIMKKGQNDIRNEHLWFGIITKTPYNTFTRVRRLTTAMSLLQSLMLLNLMFFGIRDKDDPGQFIEVLDQKIHVTSVIISIQSAFIIFLLGILISMMFTRVPPPPKKITESETKYEAVLEILERKKIKESVLEDDDGSSENSEDDELGSSEQSSNTSEHLSFARKDSNFSAKPFNVNKSAVRRESSVDPKQKLSKHVSINEGILSQEESFVSDHAPPDVETAVELGKIPDVTTHWLPWWFIYVTWTVLVIYNLFLAFYIMLYGLNLGYEKSVDWTLAFFTSFLMNVFLIQPVKVILMVFILVLIFKQKHSLKNQVPVGKLNDGILLVQDKKNYNRKFKSLLPKVTCRVPVNTAEVKNVMERLALEEAAREILRDLFLYSIFMVSVLLVSYGHMDVRSQFLQTHYVKHKFLKTPIFQADVGESYGTLGVLDKVKSTEDMWDYIKTVVAPEMLINKDSISTEYDIFLMGVARLRQVRSKEDSDACKDLPSSLGIWFIEETCSYSPFYISEETKTFGHTWTVLSNISKDIIDDSPYVYRSSKELHGAILIGHHGFYSGGGYVVPFDQDDQGGMEDAITNLYNSDWIDQLTKCIFVEFTLYNAASDQFTNVVIMFEFSNFGVVFPSVFINSARLLNQELQKKLWLQISQGIMVISSAFYTFAEIQHFRKMGLRQYFSNLWRCLEVLTIVLTAAVGISFFLRYYEFVEIVKNLQKYGNKRFLNFEPVFQMHEQLHISLAMLGGVVIFKMLKVTAFNPLVMVTFRTFTNAKSGFYGFLLITAIVFLTFAVTGLLVFGPVLRSYRSFGISLFTLLFFIMGEAEYESLVEADLFLGRLYFLAVTVVTHLLILNFYCSMLQEGFELTRYMRFQQERDTVKYMLDRIQFYTGFSPKNVKYKKRKNIIK
ncbi:hypothetical protein BsWGS_07282 [Bradybaena similaris]